MKPLSLFFVTLAAVQARLLHIRPSRPGIAYLAPRPFHLNTNIMAKSQATFMKKQLEKNRQKRKEDKEQRKLDRQQNSTGGDMELAYVNEFGEIVSTPPLKIR